jgi:hypothetical protein
MSEDLTAPLIALFGLPLLLAVILGIGTFCGWLAKQIEARQNRPRLEAAAAAKRADAERKLEEARIRRLELELGLSTEPNEVER